MKEAVKPFMPFILTPIMLAEEIQHINEIQSIECSIANFGTCFYWVTISLASPIALLKGEAIKRKEVVLPKWIHQASEGMLKKFIFLSILSGTFLYLGILFGGEYISYLASALINITLAVFGSFYICGMTYVIFPIMDLIKLRNNIVVKEV